MTVAIIDHETMTEMGSTDETMPIRVDYAALERKVLEAEEKDPIQPLPFSERAEHVETTVKKWEYRYGGGGSPTGRVITPVLGGRLSIRQPDLADVPRDSVRRRLTLERFAKEASVEEIVEAVALLDDAEGVEEEPEETSTFALPAVWKMTGKASTNKLAHRSAAHVQQIFNEAGWGIAVWFGEATRSYWVMDESGLHEFETITAMYQGMGWSDIPGEGIVKF